MGYLLDIIDRGGLGTTSHNICNICAMEALVGFSACLNASILYLIYRLQILVIWPLNRAEINSIYAARYAPFQSP